MNMSEDLITHLQSKGERITLPRRLVIDAISQPHRHLTIADIQQQLPQGPHSLSETTIYRVLQWLKALGFVSQTDMGYAGIVYALISQPYHYHLICLSCERTITLDDVLFAPLRERLYRQYGFETRIEHMALYGLCEACTSRQRETAVKGS
jgi:Fur family transcriptional regulator, ferric uptake regulator